MQLVENTVPRGLPLVEIVEPATIRLISTAYIEEPAMAPLADTDAALAFLEEIERKTSLRQNEDMPLPSDVRQDELLTSAYGYGWTYVNAAFCYTRPQGSRFNDGNRGAWYAAFGDAPKETAVAEVGHHLTRELDNVGRYENVTRYRELIAGFLGPFVDLRDQDGADYLDPVEKVAMQRGKNWRGNCEAPISVVLSIRRHAGPVEAAWRLSARHLSRTSDKERLGSLPGQARPNSL